LYRTKPFGKDRTYKRILQDFPLLVWVRNEGDEQKRFYPCKPLRLVGHTKYARRERRAYAPFSVFVAKIP
jgi:hypothetical protein